MGQDGWQNEQYEPINGLEHEQKHGWYGQTQSNGQDGWHGHELDGGKE